MQIIQTERTREFRLSENFLEPYRIKGDAFPTLLARSTYLTKYCRDNETWTDTIRRVVEGNASLAPNVSACEAEMMFHLFWTGQVLPPGRSLWVGGVPNIPADSRFNCFSAETCFWANGKLVSFEEAVGKTLNVLANDGQWRQAEVRSFGKQKLYRYVLKGPKRSKFVLEYVATADHRWFTSNRGEITDLRVGDCIKVTPASILTTAPSYVDGFAHGFVFGDGSKDALSTDLHRLRLCDKKAQYAGILKTACMFYNESSPPSFDGDPLLYFRSARNLKMLPSDDLCLEYQAGFLAGWLAADDSLRVNGNGGNRLSSQNSEALDWVADRAPLLGFCVTGRHMDSSEETNYGVRSDRLEILTLRQEPVEYTVRAIIDEGREEEVFCVTEPVTGSFTLAGGVVTGNCWFTMLRSLDDWCWTADRLMLGGGVGVGIYDSGSLPHIEAAPCRLAIWCREDHPNYQEIHPDSKAFLNGQTPVFRVQDSREGWVKALRIALSAAFTGQDWILDVSDIRPRGAPIRTFGGTACGPGPLASMLRNVWEIIRSAAGNRLSSVNCLDITNHIGFCVKSGNVRRCLPGDALVHTERGRIPIRYIEVGNRVLTTGTKSAEYMPVTAHFNQGVQALVEVHTRAGILRCTQNHRVAVLDAQGSYTFKMASELTPDDTMLALRGAFEPVPVLGVLETGTVAETYDIEVAGAEEFIADGFLVHNSALIVLGDPDDREFRNAKKDFEAVKSHRHTSNNTLVFRSEKQIADFDWHGLVEDLAVLGEPGIMNLPLVRKTDAEAEGLNPCLVGESRVATHLGLLRIDKLEEMRAPLAVTVDTRVLENYKIDLLLIGTQFLSASPAFKTAESADVFRVTTRRGYSVLATSYHKFPTPTGFLQLSALQEGSVLMLQSDEGQWGTFGDEDTGFALGSLIANANPDETLCFESTHIDFFEETHCEYGHVPEIVWRGCSECVCGFIRGFFASKGHVDWVEGKQFIKLRICDVPDSLLAQIQILLSNFGIVSELDGFSLVITDSNAREFSERIGFSVEAHRSEFLAWLASEGGFVCAEPYTDEVESIEPAGSVPVYCTTQGSYHSFVANGIVTGNCGEQALHNREACNLAEVFPSKFQESTDPELAFRLATRYCMRQRLTPLLDPVSDAVGRKNMRVGVSLGGICDFDWTPGLLSHYFRQCREEADSYAKELKVARPLTVTTVKPSGTLSLLFNSSPGVHAPYAPFFVRRTRLASNDPLVEPLMDAGVPYEADVYDSTGHTLVFSFPMRAIHTKVTVQNQTLRGQFERQAIVQEHWADNAVSSTITFGADEKEELAQCLKEYVPRLKSTSCLPKSHGYAQAPYEEIDASVWAEMSKGINYKHPLTRGGEMDDGGECAGGVCPIR